MTYQFNPERGDITDPEEEELDPGCYMMAFNTPDGLCSPKTGCPSCAQRRRRNYYGGSLIAERVSSKNGPLLAAAPKLLAMAKIYVQEIGIEDTEYYDDLVAAIAEAEGRQ